MSRRAGSRSTGRDGAIRRRPAGRALAVGALGLMLATACSDGDAADVTVPADFSDTVALGELPEPPSDGVIPVGTVEGAVESSSTTSTTSTVPRLDGPVGEVADGNRLLLIGDSVLASSAPRNDGIACDVLTGFGWDVEVDAEPGRFVDFASAVLDERLDPGAGLDWDAAVIFLGNLFDGDLVGFEAELDAALTRLAPRPVVLYTLTGDSVAVDELNEVIRSRVDVHPNIAIVDWAAHVAAETDRELLDGDGPQLTEEGSGRIIVLLAGVLDRAPAPDAGAPDDSTTTSEAPTGECLEPAFTDDSAIVL
jgi:hypothetical protein